MPVESEAWQQWLTTGHFSGKNAIADYANPEQLNRYDWYTNHGWTVPYPGDKAVYYPAQVPGANLPADYLGGD
jgi:hypothetical protein